MKIKNIIYDLGGVLIDASGKEYFDSLGYDEKVKERVKDVIHHAPIWDKFDLGIFPTYKDAIPTVVNMAPDLEDEIKRFFSVELLDAYTPIPAGVDVLYQLKKAGYPLYLISNYAKDGYEHISSKYPFFKEFEGTLVSYKVKLRKPDIRIYRLLIEKFDFMAEECLVLDDNIDNIEAAKSLGFQTILYRQETILEELKKLGVF